MINPLKKKSLVLAVAATCSFSGHALAGGNVEQQIAQLQAQTQKLQAQLQALRDDQGHQSAWKMSQKKKRKHAQKLKAPSKGLGFHGVSVVTSPYLGLRSPFDGSHLLVNG